MGALFLVRLGADVNWDGVVFIAAAKKFSAAGFSEGFSAWPKFPAYPFLISMVHHLIPDWVTAGRSISLVSSIVAVAGVYRLAEERFGTETALLSSLVFTFLPETLLQSNSIYRDPAFLAAFIWSIYFFQKSIASGKHGTLAAALSLLLLSSMFRAEGLCVLVVYICVLLIDACRNAASRKKNFRLMLICISALCLSGMIFFAASKSSSEYIEQLVTSFSGYNNSRLAENYKRLSEQLQAINDVTPSSDVGVHFGGLAKRMIPVIFGLGLINVFASTLLISNAVLAVIGIKNTQWNASNSFIIASAASCLAVLYFYFVSYDLMLNRWVLPAVALVCPWVGAGIYRIFQSIQKLRYARLLYAGVIAALVMNSAIEFNKFFKAGDNLARTAGAWISRQGYFDEANTVFNDPVVAFYAGMELSFTGRHDTPLYLNNDDKTFTSIEAFAKERKSDFIVVYVKTTRIASIAHFHDFMKLKEFEIGNKMVLIFCSLSKYPQVISQPGNSKANST